jgi:hypothetical protein
LPADGSFNWSTAIASFKFAGCGQNLTPTTTTVSSSTNPSTYGQQVTFTATVSPSAATGTVQFFDGSTSLGTSSVSGGGTASLSTSILSAASHSITAAYSGDSIYSGNTSPALTQTVNKATTSTAVTSSLNPSTYAQSVTFTATVSPSAATGTVQFFDGSTSLGTAPLSGGKASLSTSSLSVGSHSITASYGGDSNDAPSTSNTLTQTVNPTGADFTISVSPPSQTVTRGSSTSYTVTVTPVNSFTGNVSLSVSGLPARATGSFTPPSITITGGSGSSTLTVLTSRNTQRGTSNLTITGTSGSLTHSFVVKLTVN